MDDDPKTGSGQKKGQPSSGSAVAGGDSETPCSAVGRHALSLFVRLLNEYSDNGLVKMDDARRLANAMISPGGPLEHFYQGSYAKCLEHHEEIRQRSSRKDFLCRIIVETFCHLFNDPDCGIGRHILGQFQTAVRMLLGEKVFAECMEISLSVAEEKGLLGESGGDWKSFYADQRCVHVLERSLIAIAGKFRRFDMRLGWFINLINTDLEMESIGTHAFIHKQHGDNWEKPPAFTERDFFILFSAMFNPVRLKGMDKERTRLFAERYGITTKQAFGSFFVKLAKLGSQRGVKS